MKAKITMTVEINKEHAEDWEIKSHIADALGGYEGNEIEFTDCKIKEIICGLKYFENNTNRVICIETFEAKHSNAIGRKVETKTKTFVEGIIYECYAWRPEGMVIDNFFVFDRDASKFARIP